MKELTSIYQKVLGTQFHKLHPMLQHRYTLTKEKGFIGKGMMDEITGGNYFIRKMFHFGVPYRVFFPERGRKVPFLIENKVVIGQNGEDVVEWNRTFSFKKHSRHFDAIMFLDERNEEIVDLFGKPSILGSTLSLKVNERDGSLLIRSVQQWLVVNGEKLPLPRILHGEARIIESYDDAANLYKIQVEVKNPLLGTLFHYKGSFMEVERDSQYET
ncbi:MAG TPA: DUF4166 domain-containing protein [Pseudoneobacillus sp.]|nr:DUF4166 domain-containing protein [Pseudoneobacillus sp.]